MKKLIVVVSFLIAVSAHADDALIRKNGCIACHCSCAVMEKVT